MQNHNASELTTEQAALLEQIKRDGCYVDFDRLSSSGREVAKELKEKGLLLDLLSKRGSIEPQAVHAIHDEYSLLMRL